MYEGQPQPQPQLLLEQLKAAEALALQTEILDTLTGKKTPEKSEGASESYNLSKPHASLNYKEVNFQLNAPREAYGQGRPGASRDITIRLPIGTWSISR